MSSKDSLWATVFVRTSYADNKVDQDEHRDMSMHRERQKRRCTTSLQDYKKHLTASGPLPGE